LKRFLKYFQNSSKKFQNISKNAFPHSFATAVKGKGCKNWLKPTETKFNQLKLLKTVNGEEKTSYN
jgi:hypothetical protein